MKALDVDRFARRWTMALFIITWSLSSMCRSLFQKQVSFYEENGKKFFAEFHRPVFLNLIMALSMLPAALVTLVRKKCSDQQQTSTKVPKLIWILLPVCGFLDVVQCWTLNRAISDVGMQFGSLVITFDLVFISLIKRFFLKVPLQGFAIFSVSLVVLFTCLSTLADNMSNTSKLDFKDKSQVLTIFLQILGEVFRSILFVIEEHTVHNTDMQCETFVSMLGLYDLIISLFMHSPIAYFVSDSEWGKFYENICTSFEMLFNSKAAVFACFTYLIVSFFMNIVNTRYMYYTNAINLSICSGFSASINWILETIAKLLPKNPYFAALQDVNEKLDYWSILKGFCYAGILFALLVFSRVIELPCFTYPEETRYVISMDEIEN